MASFGKIYISGKISGIESIAPALFEQAEMKLIALGWEVINPTTIKHIDLDSWIGCMKTDIIELMKCDCIFMLSNWETSKGAIIELKLAADLGMKIMYEEEPKLNIDAVQSEMPGFKGTLDALAEITIRK
jgi:hypothetical protein